MSEEYCEVEVVRVITETPDALLVKVAENDDVVSVEGKDELWVPKSQIHEDSEVYKENTSGKLCVKRWLAEKRGWM